jgi:hypothetical protein
MKFMLTYRFGSETRNEAIARFKTTGGRTPKGAQLLGRWTTADLNGGFALLESYDIKALAEFTLERSDLMELEIVPLIPLARGPFVLPMAACQWRRNS